MLYIYVKNVYLYYLTILVLFCEYVIFGFENKLYNYLSYTYILYYILHIYMKF